MRKITKSSDVPLTLQKSPVPYDSGSVDKAVYRADDVRKQLMADQHRKCAYCECRVTEEYNDVEHYRPKEHYYWLGHQWDNLLYSCNLCNRSFKKAAFPLVDENKRALSPADNIQDEEPLIINPVTDDPLVHIRFERWMLVGITVKGKKTISLFHLNDSRKRSTLIHDRRVLWERYTNAVKLKNVMENLLLRTDLPEEMKPDIAESLRRAILIIKSCKSSAEPYSGMLERQ